MYGIRDTLDAYLEYKLSHIGYSFICRARRAFEAMQVVTCQYEVPDEFIRQFKFNSQMITQDKKKKITKNKRRLKKLQENEKHSPFLPTRKNPITLLP